MRERPGAEGDGLYREQSALVAGASPQGILAQRLR